MELDSTTLKQDDKVHHLLLGAGFIKTTTDDFAVAVFGKQEMMITSGTITNNGVKMIGLGAPLVYWPKSRHTREVSAYLPAIEAMAKL